jgi:hypothetical protein
MFNLEQAIADWRRQMAAKGLKTAEVLDELESHLRDEIEHQIRSGADEERAYEAAVARIGQAAALGNEFAKLKVSDGWSSFLKTCYLLFLPSMLFINIWTLLEYELSSLERALGFCAVSVICMYLGCLPYLLRSLPAAAYVRFAKVVKVATLLLWLWPIWALLEAEKIVRSGLGIVPSMVLWCLYAAVAMTAFVLSLKGSSHRPDGSSGGPLPPLQPHPAPIPPSQPSVPDFGSSLPRTQMLAPGARAALEAAREEAWRLGHNFIGTEHVLLGVLKLAKGTLVEFLHAVHLDCDTVRAEIERVVSAFPAHHAGATVSFTPRANKALRFAAREAQKLNQTCIGAEHIFLGLILEGGGVAGVVLRRLGIHIKGARAEMFGKLRTDSNC